MSGDWFRRKQTTSKRRIKRAHSPRKRNPERKFHSGYHISLSSFNTIIKGHGSEVKVT